MRGWFERVHDIKLREGKTAIEKYLFKT